MVMQETIQEQARKIPVFRKCDLLVVGGGPAGSAAATAAAKLGADVILVERYGHLGGMSTGGLCLFIDRMTDWEGRQVIAGFANDLLDRMPKEGMLGPDRALWGSKDPETVDYWAERNAALHGVVTWSPTIDPEELKIASNELILERGVKLLLHSFAVAPILEGNEIHGAIFESKSGRQAILAKCVIDCTGDGDIFAMAGAPFETDTHPGDFHSAINAAFRWGGVDFERYASFRREHKPEFEAIMAHGATLGVTDYPHRLPRDDTALFMGPRLMGYSCLDVEDLTKVEIESRRQMVHLLDFYHRYVPGFESAWIIETAPQLGVRHSRRLLGVKKVERSEWQAGRQYEDEIGLCPSPSPRYPTLSFPLGALTPPTVENLLAAGRNLSCDAASHTFLREVPVCWMMGQAAGVAAAVAVSDGVPVRAVDVKKVQQQLLRQGVSLNVAQPTIAAPVPEPGLRQLGR